MAPPGDDPVARGSETDFAVWDEMLDAPGDRPTRAALSERRRDGEIRRRLADVQAVFDEHPAGTDVPDVADEVMRRLVSTGSHTVRGTDSPSNTAPWDRIVAAWRAWVQSDGAPPRDRTDRVRLALAAAGVVTLVLGSVLWLPVDAGGLSGAVLARTPLKPGGIVLFVSGVALLVAAYARGRG